MDLAAQGSPQKRQSLPGCGTFDEWRKNAVTPVPGTGLGDSNRSWVPAYLVGLALRGTISPLHAIRRPG